MLCTGPSPILFYDETPKSAFRSWVINGKTYANTTSVWEHTPTALGNQDITLIASDSNGCVSTVTKNRHIIVYSDISLNFQLSNTSHCLPYTTNISSSDTLRNQTVASYLWNIPNSNNTAPTTQNVSNVTYNNAGIYSISLSVTTNQGCVYEKLKTDSVLLGNTATLGVNTSKNLICLSEYTTITQTTNNLPGTFTWKINSTNRNFTNKNTGNFSFRDTGYYDLNLTYNHNECISTYFKGNIVKAVGQKADFKSNNAFHCEAPHTVNLVNTSDTISGSIISYKWEIIDRNTNVVSFSGSTKNINANITKDPSYYDVKLMITDGNGCQDTLIKSNYIRIDSYKFNFFAKPSIGCVDQTVQFTNNTPSPSYYGLDLFSWDFYDRDGQTIIGSSASFTPTLIYTETGHYSAKITAANPLGCQSTLKKHCVRIVDPVLDFWIEDTIICSSEATQVIGLGTPKDPNFEHSYT